MYNGIGLQSVRGSGTSGYVTKNAAHIPHRRSARDDAAQRWGAARAEPLAQREPSKEILEHEVMRRVEVELAELRDTLEATGALREDEIERRLDARRAELAAKAERAASSGRPLARADADARGETHRAAAAKQAEDVQVRKALGIVGEHVVGAAFDRDLQAHLKMERMAARDAAEAAREQKAADAARALARAAREEEKQARRAERAVRKDERRSRREEARAERERARGAEKGRGDGGLDDNDGRDDGSQARAGSPHGDGDESPRGQRRARSRSPSSSSSSSSERARKKKKRKGGRH